MTKKLNIREFFASPRNQYYFGLLITLLVTLAEVAKWKQRNFFIYRYATLDMWAGKIPYGHEWAVSYGLDSFLYGPLFTLLFSPFAFLPPWLGPFLWNILNFSLFFYAIRNLPIHDKKKTNFFFFILLMMANNLMYYQYNLLVASIFLIAFSFMEKGRFIGAIVLIGISGFTKIYGVFQYAFLIFYKKYWRNVLAYIIPTLLIMAALPLIMMSADHLQHVYTKWVSSFPAHFKSREWMSIFHYKPFFAQVPVSTTFYQLGSLGILAILSLVRLKRSEAMPFRAQAVGIMMGWVILFSNSPEIGTYLIAMCGLALWFFTRENKPYEKALFLLNFFIFMIVPQDIFFPKKWMHVVIEQAQFQILLFFITWVWMIWTTYGPVFKIKLTTDNY